ncbi:MAG: leucyl/phenylalanyl-tRNA--protein transferase [Pseudomonadota bacterium]
MAKPQPVLTWLEPAQEFPPVSAAWGANDPAPGLLAAGGTLDVATLINAYSRGIFPWFSKGQPNLWWSPDPRMVLQTKNFRLHRSLRKTVNDFCRNSLCEVRFDSCFADVILACATKSRHGQPGTWILPSMVDAYTALHQAGHAHSVETWINGELAGGLYCVNLGAMVFGESMFANRTDASKIALAALVAFCSAQHITMIDCQQNTQHLASLGADVISRENFAGHLQQTTGQAAPTWRFEPVYWDSLLQNRTTPRP